PRPARTIPGSVIPLKPTSRSGAAVAQWAANARSSALRPAPPAESNVPSTSKRSTVGRTRGITRLPERSGRYVTGTTESTASRLGRGSAVGRDVRGEDCQLSQPELAGDDDQLDLRRAFGDGHEWTSN